MARLLRQMMRREDGAALVEFALVAPVMVLGLIGLFDLSYNIYTSSMLEGAIQKAARDSSIEHADASTAAIDERVSYAVHRVAPHATLAFNRAAYTEYADVSRPEDFTDSNGDGQCNDGEPFEDVNGNGIWDSDRARSGTGNARDAVVYTVTVTYPRQFPLHGLIGVPDTVTTVARTVLRNQPYAVRETGATLENCS